MNVLGRGPARRLELTAEREQLQAGGRDSTLVRVRAFDQWDNPAADGQVAVATSSGHLLRPEGQPLSAKDRNDNDRDKSLEVTEDFITDNANATLREVVLSLRGGEAVVRLVSDNAAGTAEIKAQTGDITQRAAGASRRTPPRHPRRSRRSLHRARRAETLRGR